MRGVFSNPPESFMHFKLVTSITVSVLWAMEATGSVFKETIGARKAINAKIVLFNPTQRARSHIHGYMQCRDPKLLEARSH